MQNINTIISNLTTLLAQTAEGKYTITLAGSHAKGGGDLHSDIDFFVFYEKAKPIEIRKQLIESIADSDKGIYFTDTIDEYPWGGSMDFYYQGIPIEVTTRSIEKMKSTIYACLDGKFEVTPAAWTTNGYYSYIYLSELSFIKPIDDSYGLITSLKEHIVHYPPKLKQGIINHFWWRATLWLDNFHYLSAIEREDILFTSGIVKNSLYDLIQIIFALNEVYFKGDKKLIKQLSELDYCPILLLTHTEFLLCAPSDVIQLRKQRELLMQIVDDVKVHLT